ncbi:MAG TPA: DNA polymerase III subunit alpha, partial [Firmicutes bacterium]|nr:DNA polymerase III subunit alpha [Bacillota bacterium]
RERLSLEKEMLGLYISGHPLEPYRLILENMTNLTNCAELKDSGDNHRARVGGIITAVRKFYTKKNKQMAFIRLEDLTGGVEIVIFPDLFENRSQLLEEDNLVLIDGRTDLKEDEEPKIIAESIRPLNKEQKYLQLNIGERHNHSLLEHLKNTLIAENGETPVCLYFEKDKKMLVLKEEYWVRDHPSCLERLENLLGPGSVIEQFKTESESFPAGK